MFIHNANGISPELIYTRRAKVIIIDNTPRVNRFSGGKDSKELSSSGQTQDLAWPACGAGCLPGGKRLHIAVFVSQHQHL